MSFDLVFWRSAGEVRVGEAAGIYERLVEGDSGVVAEAEEIAEFYGAIVSVYPDITVENMDETPWASPIYWNRECLIVTISWSRCGEVAPVLVDLSRRYGLVAYDPQDGVVIV
ncbi:hypothetical protein [Actinocorallia sp. A-T 12471]|uniref:hypothetical protein n=1 Tax=Actinocorallia sp. A-T 12471 TaxID=3089813 RepID=UPI0029CBD13C|nr:hypothetical protein [Actinocorallia sp. A-T 12471]MDX6740106.1 hypothetical protein [Actinocorallia sp. A-T 12471]